MLSTRINEGLDVVILENMLLEGKQFCASKEMFEEIKTETINVAREVKATDIILMSQGNIVYIDIFGAKKETKKLGCSRARVSKDRYNSNREEAIAEVKSYDSSDYIHIAL